MSSIEITEDSITVHPDEAFARAYLADRLTVHYDIPGGLVDVDQSIAVIPYLANVAPIVWLSGIDVTVPAVDEAFLASLEDLRAIFAEMYPQLAWKGRIHANTTVAHSGSDETVLLFSGGVDSVHSSLAIGQPQVLVTIQGSDVALGNTAGWVTVRNQASRFAAERGHRNAFIRSNFRDFLRIGELERLWPDVDDWWAGVQHGMGLLGLVAPITTGGKVIISATHTPEFGRKAWASNPTLDTNVRWGSVEVDHHGYEQTRQEKVQAVVDAGAPPPHLRVCFSNKFGTGDNCERCEKCLRTYAAIVAAGGEPTEHGFSTPTDKGLRLIRQRFSTYRVALKNSWHWEKVQEAVSPEQLKDDAADPARTDFLTWLTSFDFARYERRWQVFLGARKGAIRGLRRIPGAESGARQVQAGANRARKRLSRSSSKS